MSVKPLALLLTLTLASFLVMEVGGGANTAEIILLVAFVKVAIIGARFMEISTAPTALVLAFTAWTLGTGSLLAVLLHT